MKASRIVMLVVGVFAGFLAVGLIAGGLALVVIHGTQRDADGFYSTQSGLFETSTAAITSDQIDLRSGPGEWGWARRNWLTVRVETYSAAEVFVGIGRQLDVERYLDGVAYDRVEHIDFRPFDAAYLRMAGSVSAAEPPVEQDFWVARSTGAGDQTLRWDVRPGRWLLVVMNADGSPGVAVEASAGVRTDLLLPIGIGLLVTGLVVLALSVLLVVLGVRDRARTSTAPPAAPHPGEPEDLAAEPLLPPPPPPTSEAEPGVEPARAAHPVRLDGELQPDLSRWLWLVKWFLAIPHYVVLVFLWMAFFLLTVAAFFAIVFTGRYPRGIFDFNLGVVRWTWRVTFYAFTLGTDRYPPFSLEPDPTYPASFAVAYPEQGLSRGLVWVKWWLLAIPHYLVVAVFGGGPGWLSWSWSERGSWAFSGGLISILVLIAAIGLLFTNRYPRSIFDLVMGLYRWSYRVLAYVALMRDEYPPFRLDSGGPDPGTEGRERPMVV
jgi:hypothetical protein